MKHYRTKPLTEKGSLGFNNPLASTRPSTGRYKNGLSTFLLQKELSVYVGRFVWKGLPEGITGNLMETMLYYKGQLAFFKTGSKYYVLPFVYTGTLNHYGLPEKVLPIPFNGKVEDEKNPRGFIQEPKNALLYMDDTEHDEMDIAVILRERSGILTGMTYPTMALTSEIREKLVEHLILLRNNVILSQPVTYISVDTQDKANSLGNQFDNMLYDVLNGNVVQTIVGQLRLDKTTSEAPRMQAQQLWQSYSSLDALRLEGMGIINAGTFEKSERILQGEIAGKQSESKLVLEDNLLHRQLFCDMVNKYFGLQISVSLSKVNEDYQPVKEDDGRVGGFGEGDLDER